MIDAKVTPQANGKFKVEFIAPVGDKSIYQTLMVNSKSDAERVMYFQNRKYITQHLINFLKQRQYALGLTKHYHQQIADAQVMINQLEVFGNASFHTVQKWVYNHEALINEFAPGEKSSHYKHYETVILPILMSCRPIRIKEFV